MVLRLIRALPGDRALLPPSFAGLARDLDASVGASGPHAFAVRVSVARLATPQRPPHPAPNVRDDREAPLLWERDGGNKPQFLIFGKLNFCAWPTDNSNQLELAHEIRFYAHAIFRSARRSRATRSTKTQLNRPTTGKSVVGADWSLDASVLIPEAVDVVEGFRRPNNRAPTSPQTPLLAVHR
jgi:hypothetical protein